MSTTTTIATTTTAAAAPAPSERPIGPFLVISLLVGLVFLGIVMLCFWKLVLQRPASLLTGAERRESERRQLSDMDASSMRRRQNAWNEEAELSLIAGGKVTFVDASTIGDPDAVEIADGDGEDVDEVEDEYEYDEEAEEEE